jgi:hypothetical protein
MVQSEYIRTTIIYKFNEYRVTTKSMQINSEAVTMFIYFVSVLKSC